MAAESASRASPVQILVEREKNRLARYELTMQLFPSRQYSV